MVRILKEVIQNKTIEHVRSKSGQVRNNEISFWSEDFEAAESSGYIRIG